MTRTDQVTVPDTGAAASTQRTAFTQRALGIGGALIALNVAGQIAVSLREDDDGMWLAVGSVVVASILFGGIAFGLSHRAMRRSATTQVRTVVGLTVLAVLLAPVAWWSSAPALVALQAWLLERVTGVGQRPGGNGAARAASIVAVAVAVGLVVFPLVVLASEQL